ncbi:hypothetical protein B0H34DRAFT_856898 [Crassisporium funariophilum]|nr:hypothetical protein B0H34DRAFT_856898 [Crassisporium funariophilum]
MPSTTLQKRISAFESIAAPSLRPASNHPATPHSAQKSALDILETPLSPTTAASLQPVAAFTRPSPSPSPPNLGRKTSLIDLHDWVVDDGPSPVRAANGHIDSTETPTQMRFDNKRHSANRNGGLLISLESPPRPKPRPKPANLSSVLKPPQLPPRRSSYTSLKSVASSSSHQSCSPPPPAFLYPPRKHSDSLTVDHARQYPPHSLDLDARSRGTSAHAPSSSISSFHSVSLSSDTDPSTPGSVANFIATFPMDREPTANGKQNDADSVSLSESYEEVSASLLASPATERTITLDWEKAMAKRKPMPPKLPQRPNSGSSSSRSSMKSPPPPAHPISRVASGSHSTPPSPIIKPTASAASLSNTVVTTYAPRRAAPPPPSRSSDRSSIQSTATTHSFSSSSQSHQSRNTYASSDISLKTKRPTPVPLAARRRYEEVFNSNVIQRRKAEKCKQDGKPALLSPAEARGRRAAGWRGLSVDLINTDDMPTNSEPDEVVNEVVGSDEKLEGAIIKKIWQRSGLDKPRLAEIWNECDLTAQGALSQEAFAKGMWRIDEELRRAQTQAVKSASKTNSGSYRSSSLRANSKPPTPQKPRNILR